MKLNKLIFTYAGVGKTQLAKKYKNVKDFDEIEYKWIYDDFGNTLPDEEKKHILIEHQICKSK